jgi:group I intron endonuclease
MNSGVYLLRNKINNKLYVGKSVDIPKRWKSYIRDEHTNYRKHTQPIVNAIRKYGWKNFESSIIEYCGKDKLLKRESFWISHYKTLDRNIGYNICPFSTDSTGYKHTIESRLKMSIAQKGKKKHFSKEHIRNITIQIKNQTGKGNLNPMFGRHHTETSKNTISSILKNKYRTGEIKGCRNVNQLDADGNIIRNWTCIREASKELTGSYNYSGHISNVCRGIRKTFRGFRWEYVQ